MELKFILLWCGFIIRHLSSLTSSAVSYGSSYIEAAKPILQTSLEVASAMVTGVSVPTSASMMQMDVSTQEEAHPQKQTLARSQTIG